MQKIKPSLFFYEYKKGKYMQIRWNNVQELMHLGVEKLNHRKIMQQLDIQKIQDYALCVPKSNKIMEMLQTEVL